MKTQLILAAIKALNAADKRLKGNSSDSKGYTAGDILLSADCFSAALDLECALVEALPNIELEAEA